ncbi:MAG: SHOCT domain-containing protein [Anaerolineales bacterium]|nr:SHOCT domain-containing protein [Anaerolineales bacterium]
MKNIRGIFLISMLITIISLGIVVVVALSESGFKLGETSISELIGNEDTVIVFIAPLILLIVGASMIPFWRLIFPMQIKNGVKADAKVLEVHDTGVTINDNPQVGLRLELRTQEGATLEVDTKTIVSRLSVANVQAGVIANVIYDPLKPQRLKVESFEMPAPAPAPVEEASEERPPSTTERLLELNDLRARGLVTEQEFQAKRAEILKGL